MNQRIPEAIRPTLQDYLAQVNQQMPHVLTAFYLEGSLALGGFNQRFSDIDFVAILHRRLSPAEFEPLRAIHESIERRYPRWKMSGSYLRADNLEHSTDQAEPHPHYHDGILRSQRQFQLHSVEGWILKNHGIAVIGPDPQTLPFTVDWDLLMQKMRGNLNTYWAGWTRRPRSFAIMLSDWGIQWTVLGVLRQFYSFREHSITTKTKAGEYALTCLPVRWHRLIREAIHIREGKKSSAYPFRLVRTIEAIRFLRFIIQTCNAGFPSNTP